MDLCLSVHALEVQVANIVRHAGFGDRLAGLAKSFHYHVGHIVNEGRFRVERGTSPPVGNARLFGQLAVFDVNLLQRFNVFADEADGYHNQILHTSLAKLRQNIVRVGSEPFDRSHSGLIRKVDLNALLFSREGLRYQTDALLNLLLVRIAGFDVRLWHAVSREQHVSCAVLPSIGGALGNLLGGERIQLLLDQVCHRPDISRSIVPRRNDRVDQLLFAPLLLASCELLLKHPQTGS